MDQRRVVIIFILTGLILGTLPLYLAELNVLAHMSMYQFFPFVFAFVGAVGVMRWRAAPGGIGPRAGRSWRPETLCIVIALLALVAHAGLFGPWLGGFAGTMALAGAAFAVQRLRSIQVWDLWVLLLISMRLPLELNRQLASSLQTISSKLSSMALDSVGVLHILLGNVVALRGRELFVDEACSGIVSVMSVIACAAMLAVWRGRPLLHMLLLIVVGVGCAVLMNVMRISTIAVALDWYGKDWTSGWPHEVIGLCSFLVTFGVLIASDQALPEAIGPVPLEEIPERAGRGLVTAWNALVRFHPFRQPAIVAATWESSVDGTATAWVRPPLVRFGVLSVVAVVLGVFHSVALFAHYVSATSDPDLIVRRIMELDRRGVEAALHPWRLVSDELIERDTQAELGRFSKMYEVEHPGSGIVAKVSFDFPFYRRWHDVSGCYVNSGWRQLERSVVRDRSMPVIPDCEYIEADFGNETDGYGHLVFANLSEEGRLVAPPREFHDLGYFLNVFMHKIHHGRQVSLNPRKVFQVQVWHVQPTPQRSVQKHELEKLFYSAYEHLRRELANDDEKVTN